jgi:mutator protein MutT
MLILATASIIEKNGKILITQRSEKNHHPGMWDLPGGKLNPKEDITHCVKREVKEETNLDVDVLFPIDVVSKIVKDNHIVLIVYVCNYKSGEVKLSEEHQKYKWIEPKKAFDFCLTTFTEHALRSYLDLISN